MPGHIKLGKSGEPDPDPMPYLVVSLEMKREDMLKAYDPKKSMWVPDGQGGFKEGLLVEDDGNKATVMLGHEVKSFNYTLNHEISNFYFLEKSVQVKRAWTSQSTQVRES